MLDLIKQLRQKTGVGILEAKKILEETKGNLEKAFEILKEKGLEKIADKKTKEAKEGIIESYIHSNYKLGGLVELFCQTDFVAKNPEFKELAHEIAMQIVAMDPKNEQELLLQESIKNPEITIQKLIDQAILKFGENIKLGRFVRFKIS